jgi:hypothetical protein
MGSRLSSKGLDVHIYVLTFLVSFASSLTSPDLFFDSAVAFFTDLTASCAVSITAEVVDARRPDRRGSGMSVPSGGGAALRGMTNGCFSGGDTNRKQRSRKGLKWESNRRADHMAALLATRVPSRRRRASCLPVLSCTYSRSCLLLQFTLSCWAVRLYTENSIIAHNTSGSFGQAPQTSSAKISIMD